MDTEELDLLSRAQAIMKNIKELVSRKLELTDRIAENQEIMRLVVSEVCTIVISFILRIILMLYLESYTFTSRNKISCT